jgi:hypothetical protein
MDFVAHALNGAWDMLYDAGIYVAFGLLAAGLVHILVARRWMTQHLGGKGFGAVVKAALIGAPLPLCSCSVLPFAYALRAKGASRGATVSFLISTPETGIDSIAVTWALIGPLMAIVRPVAAVATGMVAGFFETLRERHEPPAIIEGPACAICNSDSCEHVPQVSRWRRFWRFVVFEMADDVGPTLTLGLALAGIVTVVVPDGFFEQYLGSPWVSMVVMLAVGLPLYVCATASTPVAAALMLKGLNPGAALVFLLVGPATNLATILMVGRMLGKTSAALYVGTIAIMALVCGAVLDLGVSAWSLNVSLGEVHDILPAWLYVGGAVILGAYLAHSVIRWTIRKLKPEAIPDTCHAPANDVCCTPVAKVDCCDDSHEPCGHAHEEEK